MNEKSTSDILEHILRSPHLQSPEDSGLIKKAYSFAENAHKNQVRYSGDPYFIHVAETASMLSEMNMGAKTIAAGFLHDTIEDAHATDEEIRAEFGDEVLFLVQGVTKLGRLRYHGLKRHTESLRKLFVAMAQDIRVLMIKLADRLHNVRTLEHVPDPEKRKRIAVETLEIYVPLAHRLGMGQLKGQLEDAAFAYADPEGYAQATKLLSEKSKESLATLEKMTKRIKKELAKQSIPLLKTDYRIKHLYSFWKKLKQNDMNLEKIYDIAALRIIVPTTEDCYRTLGAIHGSWKPLLGRVKDYIASPKLNGYQSLHTTIFTGDGGIVEIQIRTEEMHHEAEFGIASHVSYKEGKNGEGLQMLSFLRLISPFTSPEEKEVIVSRAEGADVPKWIRDLASFEDGGSDPKDFLNALKTDFLEQHVFAFTPKGEVIGLPEGATPIDFAYAIHTDVGNHISGAKVNGKMVSLDTELKTGDIIEIITKESSKPSQKWLDQSKTTLAKRRIRAAIGNPNQ